MLLTKTKFAQRNSVLRRTVHRHLLTSSQLHNTPDLFICALHAQNVRSYEQRRNLVSTRLLTNKSFNNPVNNEITLPVKIP